MIKNENIPNSFPVAETKILFAIRFVEVPIKVSPPPIIAAKESGINNLLGDTLFFFPLLVIFLFLSITCFGCFSLGCEFEASSPWNSFGESLLSVDSYSPRIEGTDLNEGLEAVKLVCSWQC